jgi:hypothetical protein
MSFQDETKYIQEIANTITWRFQATAIALESTWSSTSPAAARWEFQNSYVDQTGTTRPIPWVDDFVRLFRGLPYAKGESHAS